MGEIIRKKYALLNNS